MNSVLALFFFFIYFGVFFRLDSAFCWNDCCNKFWYSCYWTCGVPSVHLQNLEMQRLMRIVPNTRRVMVTVRLQVYTVLRPGKGSHFLFFFISSLSLTLAVFYVFFSHFQDIGSGLYVIISLILPRTNLRLIILRLNNEKRLLKTVWNRKLAS